MSSISCRICKAIIDCPKDEVDTFMRSFSQHLLSNSSAVTALDVCYPCLQEMSARATKFESFTGTPVPIESPYSWSRPHPATLV